MTTTERIAQLVAEHAELGSNQERIEAAIDRLERGLPELSADQEAAREAYDAEYVRLYCHGQSPSYRSQVRVGGRLIGDGGA